MMKWIIIAAIVAGGIFGIWSYSDGKVRVDKDKAYKALDKSRDFVVEHVEVK